MGFDHFGTAKIISDTTDIKILTKMRSRSEMLGFSYFGDFLCENKLLATFHTRLYRPAIVFYLYT